VRRVPLPPLLFPLPPPLRHLGRAVVQTGGGGQQVLYPPPSGCCAVQDGWPGNYLSLSSPPPLFPLPSSPPPRVARFAAHLTAPPFSLRQHETDGVFLFATRSSFPPLSSLFFLPTAYVTRPKNIRHGLLPPFFSLLFFLFSGTVMVEFSVPGSNGDARHRRLFFPPPPLFPLLLNDQTWGIRPTPLATDPGHNQPTTGRLPPFLFFFPAGKRRIVRMDPSFFPIVYKEMSDLPLLSFFPPASRIP